MGSTISAIVNQQNGDLKNQAQDQLNALLTIADLKFNAFMSTVKDTSDNTLIPVDKILLMDHVVNAGVSQDTSALTNAIKTAAGAFASDDIVDGLTAVIGAGLTAVFGNVAANQSEHTTYAITCGQLGGIMRVDLDIFCYTFTSSQLVTVTNNVVMVAYTVSSIDASKLDVATLRDIVQVCYGGLVSTDQLTAIFNQIIAAYNGQPLSTSSNSGGVKAGAVQVEQVAGGSSSVKAAAAQPAAATGGTGSSAAANGGNGKGAASAQQGAVGTAGAAVGSSGRSGTSNTTQASSAAPQFVPVPL
uniref:Uncharacterized protein n=1 Tax=Mycena chlorophos TaxID=658473 RepID=A0ABQ0L988_MYCCL|nr:predicted protein [Mycena chlorophos]